MNRVHLLGGSSFVLCALVAAAPGCGSSNNSSTSSSHASTGTHTTTATTSAASTTSSSSGNGGATTTSSSSSSATTSSSSTGTGGATSSSSSATTSSSSTGTGGATSSSSSGTGGATTSSSSSGTGGGFPAPPTLGAQIDRIGRPAINTAVTDPFDPTAATEGTTKDMYNQDGTPSDWAANWSTNFAKNLAILDAIDGTCGNQLLYKTPLAAGSYAPLTAVLIDDQLYLNTAGTTKMQYLAVEANFLGITNTDQGGRYLSYVALDTTYNVLALGALTGVSNGITMNDVAFLTAFPYEAAPH